ncbi:AAA family ATPase [Kineosporia mesophila]|uniref:AAA family ATPase n=1 Tax=Kineosporia mesophila TaxID=566012 RepID=A0ABP7ATP1_9ACTN|nr:(d)CMP kinase [Kineosporia mesophila]
MNRGTGTAPMVVEELAGHVLRRPPSVGATRLVAVDGRSGSGKTTLARHLAARLGAPLIHLDDLYEGWQGLAGVGELLHGWIAEPLEQGRTARWRPYDWATGTREAWREVPASPVVVLEGCGSGSEPLTGCLSLLIWVESDDDTRRERLRSRSDWDSYRQHHFADWARQEETLLRRENTPGRADVVVHNDPEPPHLIVT